MSIRNYSYSLHNNTEERSSRLLVAEAWNHACLKFSQFDLKFCNGCHVWNTFGNIAGIWCSNVYSKFQHQNKLGGQLCACSSCQWRRILTLCWLGGCVVPRICLDEIKRYFPSLNIDKKSVTLLTEGCEWSLCRRLNEMLQPRCLRVWSSFIS
jgi:hypothetical protein